VEPTSIMVLEKKKILTYVICYLTIVGVCWPTSLGGNINKYSLFLGYFICIGGMFLLCGVTRKITYNVLTLLAVLILLLFFTLISPLPEINLGAIFPYFFAFLVLSMSLDGLDAKIIIDSFIFISIFILLLAFGVMFEVDFIILLIKLNYQQYYPDLFEQTVVWHLKPIAVFSAHSVAGFSYFTFAILYFNLFINEKNKLRKGFYAAFMFLFLSLMPFLKSSAAFFLFFILLLLFIVYNFRKNPRASYLLLVISLFSCSIYYQNQSEIIDGNVKKTFESLSYLTSKQNGFLGRYSKNTRLEGTFNYISKNPMTGVGVSSSSGIKFGDSFLAEYVVRISFIGYVIVLMGLFCFLYKSIVDKRLVIPVFCFFLVADLGYPLLVTFKFLVLIPLFILILNYAFYTGKRYV